jgi:hypothetical protein
MNTKDIEVIPAISLAPYRRVRGDEGYDASAGRGIADLERATDGLAWLRLLTGRIGLEGSSRPSSQTCVVSLNHASGSMSP